MGGGQGTMIRLATETTPIPSAGVLSRVLVPGRVINSRCPRRARASCESGGRPRILVTPSRHRNYTKGSLARVLGCQILTGAPPQVVVEVPLLLTQTHNRSPPLTTTPPIPSAPGLKPADLKGVVPRFHRETGVTRQVPESLFRPPKRTTTRLLLISVTTPIRSRQRRRETQMRRLAFFRRSRRLFAKPKPGLPGLLPKTQPTTAQSLSCPILSASYRTGPPTTTTRSGS
mmetsp:Transcript_4288/g.14284  ORF Transcript_4288/g.14284 Transcript_4288/m.14284 type:complete len:230 (+) Transcript_4288:3-692(+)